MGFMLTFRRDAKNLHGFGKFVSAVSACDPRPEALKLSSQAKVKSSMAFFCGLKKRPIKTVETSSCKQSRYHEN